MAEHADITVSWKDYVDTRFDAGAQAIARAQESLEKRFDNTNEWRATVETLQRGYMQRTEFDAVISSLNGKVETMQRNMWIGIGIVMAIQFFIGIGLIIWKSQQ
jgi:hypothetical protein